MIVDAENAAIAAYIAQCDEALQHQVGQSDALPGRICLPLPPTPEHWQALKQWIEELTRETGKVIAFEFRSSPPR